MKAPKFRLSDVVSGRPVSLDDYKSAPALLVMFICNHCPYVRHVRRTPGPTGARVPGPGAAGRHQFQRRGAVSRRRSRGHERRSPDRGLHLPHPSMRPRKSPRNTCAACTPDFFVFDKDCRLVYRGQIDDSRPSSGRPVTGSDLRAALEAVLAGASRPGRPEAEPGLQHQVEREERAGVRGAGHEVILQWDVILRKSEPKHKRGEGERRILVSRFSRRRLADSADVRRPREHNRDPSLATARPSKMGRKHKSTVASSGWTARFPAFQST